jgi:hypothetical protein
VPHNPLVVCSNQTGPTFALIAFREPRVGMAEEDAIREGDESEIGSSPYRAPAAETAPAAERAGAGRIVLRVVE